MYGEDGLTITRAKGREKIFSTIFLMMNVYSFVCELI